MSIGVIGDTGFIGSNLLRQVAVDARYNSRTIEASAGRRFDLLIIAGAPGAKWRANQDPLADADAIRRLASALDRVTARRVVLISTVDVYPRPIGVTETSRFNSNDACAYGRHRWELEQRVIRRFDAVVIRLPGLFGPGLKKNVVYDLLNGHRLDRINPDDVFQWYPLDRLWLDIRLSLAQNLPLVNLASEPVGVREMAREAFGVDLAGAAPASPIRYDVRSHYERSFGGRRGYLADKAETLRRLKTFVDRERACV